MLITRIVTAGSIAFLMTIGCVQEIEPLTEDAEAAAETPAKTFDIADSVERFKTAIAQQDRLMKQYPDPSALTIRDEDRAPFWTAYVAAIDALAEIADQAKMHPDWAPVIVEWWDREIEPVYTRQHRRGDSKLQMELAKQAAPDVETFRKTLGRQLGAGVTLDRLAKAVHAGSGG